MKWKFPILLILIMILANANLIWGGDDMNKKIYENETKSTLSNFTKEGYNDDYGTIKISKTEDWEESNRIAEYVLTTNTKRCGELCYMNGRVKLYQEGKLFDDADFEDINKNSKQLSYYQYFIKTTNSSYNVTIPIYEEVCKTPKANLTNPSPKEECWYELIGYEKEERPYYEWTPYNYEVLEAGEYEWRLEGRKGFYESVDAIPIAYDLRFNEWAEWGSGGTITTNGSYNIHTFYVNGTFEVTSASLTNITILMVGGGGSGGSAGPLAGSGGGGGAGGLIYNISYPVSVATYNITIGSGASPGAVNGASGLKGGNSVFVRSDDISKILTAVGGGYGAKGGGSNTAGGPGGSGGGGGSLTGSGGSGTAGQGNDGGAGTGSGAPHYASAGGGGAGAVGSNAGDSGGNGGDGLAYDINGSVVYYAGGGGGGAYFTDGEGGTGGNGGGGRGGDADGTPSASAGTDGLGGGGGGGGYDPSDPELGENGGDGVIIIKYYQEERPDVNVTYPENKTYTATVTALNYTVSNAQNCWYSTDSGSSNSSTVGAGINFTGLSSVEGSNEWTVYCNDTSNVLDSSTVAFTIDTPVANTTTTTTIASCRYKKLGYYNTKLPWLRQTGCL